MMGKTKALVTAAAILIGLFVASVIAIAVVHAKSPVIAATPIAATPDDADPSPATAPTSRPAFPPADPAKAALMKRLADLRAATYAANRSGRGVAQLEFTRKERGPLPGVDSPIDSADRHPATFAFDDTDFIETGADASNSNARLRKGNVILSYFAGRPNFPAPSALSTDTMTRQILWDWMFHAWSFRGFAQLPPLLLDQSENENPALDYLPRVPEIRIELAGETLSVSCDDPKIMGVGDQTRLRLLIEFDLAHGGMMTHYHNESTSKDSRFGKSVIVTEVTEDWVLTWTNFQGHVVPKSREVKTLITEDGKVNNGGTSKITFDSFTIGPVDAAKEFTIDQMSIRKGTRLSDFFKADMPQEKIIQELVEDTDLISQPRH